MAGWHRIDTTGVPRMAFGQPTDSEIASFYYPVFRNGLLGVAGAGGMKAAIVAQERAEQRLVAGNHEYEEAAHQESWLLLGVEA